MKAKACHLAHTLKKKDVMYSW